MTLSRRRLLEWMAAAPVAASALGTATWAHAQAFPSKPLRLVNPFAPGGGADAASRAIAPEMASLLGQPVVVDNRPGAGGTVAASEVSRAPADGYTLFQTLGSLHSITPMLFSSLPFRPNEDLVPVAPMVAFNNVLVVHPNGPKTLQELIEAARREPGKLTFASSGNGTTTHLVGEMFKVMAGVNIVHVPYQGSAPALNDLMGGHVTMIFDTIPSAMSHMRGGKLRGLATTGAARAKLFPEIPTMIESGLKGFEAGAWYGLLAPAGTPADVVARLNEVATAAVRTPAFSDRMLEIGFEIIPGPASDITAMVQRDTAMWKPIIEGAGIKIN